MKANPMNTAPKDGRRIIVITPSGSPELVEWRESNREWMSVDKSATFFTTGYLFGWIEDIEPPEENKAIIGAMSFERVSFSGEMPPNGIRIETKSREATLTDAEAERLHAWLSQWHGRGDE